MSKMNKHFTVSNLRGRLSALQLGETEILAVSKGSTLTQAQRLLTATVSNTGIDGAAITQIGVKCVPLNGHTVTDAIIVTRTA